MPDLIGENAQYGIPEAEAGMFVESLSFRWVPEWVDQKDNKGRICGKRLVDEYLEVSLSGALKLDGAPTWTGASIQALVNAVPELWCNKPAATTTVVTDVSYNYSNSDVTKADLTLTIYGFAASAE